jgi:hypothetical protein
LQQCEAHGEYDRRDEKPFQVSFQAIDGWGHFKDWTYATRAAISAG